MQDGFIKFKQSSFDNNDKRARDKAKELFSSRYKVYDNPDQYGVDLLCYIGKVLRVCVEVEVKSHWQGQHFNWNEINIPYRKKKFFEQHKHCKFVMFNSDLTACFILDGKTILECKHEEVSNQRNASGEYFYKVPVELAIVHNNI